jgi:DNA helicase-2/ATP-dependent DNA helicase PcrA
MVKGVFELLRANGIADLDDGEAFVMAGAERVEADSFASLLGSITVADAKAEQDLALGAVNLLTMHKAKGLSARVVVVMACEDEYLPGRQQDVDGEADERRLLYVSLTRARERLCITYANRRLGAQVHTGRDSGRQKRSLTRYLRNAPVHPVAGDEFVRRLGQAPE